MRISWKLLLMSLLLPLALATVAGVSYLMAEAALNRQVLNQLESLASTRKARIEAITNQNTERLLLVSSRTQLRLSLEQFIRSADAAHQQKMNRILLDARSSIRDFRNVSVATLDGKVVASTDPSRIGTQYPGDGCFEKARTGNVVDFLFLGEDQELRVHLCGPLRLDEKVLGVAVIEADAQNIFSVVHDYTGLGKTGETVLVRKDEKGNALYLTPLRFDAHAALKRTVSKEETDAPVTHASSGTEALFKNAKDYRGKRVLAATRHVDKVGWGLVVKIDEQEAFAHIAQLRNLMALVIPIVSAVFIVCALLIARSIRRPIAKLTETATRITDGDLSRRATAASKDEIGTLARAFNRMTDGLAGHMAEREKVSEELRAVSSRQEAILSSVPDIIMEVDENKVYTWANKAGVEFFGEDVIGKDASYYFEGDQETYGTVQPLFDGDENTIYVESWQRRKDGERRLLGWWCRVLKDTGGKVKGALSTARDITETSRAQEKISHLNAVLRAIRNVNQLIVKEKDRQNLLQKACNSLIATRGYGFTWIALFDKNGHFITAAQAGLKGDDFTPLVEGLSRGELVQCARRVLGQSGIVTVGDPKTICTDCPLSHKHNGSAGMHIRLEHDKRVYGVLMVSVPQRLAGDEEEEGLLEEVAGDVGYALHDMELEEERMRGESALRESKNRLENALEELRQAQEKAIKQARMSAFGEMASGIAHDFNNALSPILGFSELALSHPGTIADEEKIGHYFTTINTAAKDAARVVSRLRQFYLRREDKDALRMIDLNGLVEQVVTMTRPRWRDVALAKGEKIEIKTDLGKISQIPANEAEMREVLMNLIFNAVDAMPRGGTVTIGTRQNKDHVVLTVKDTGSGMNEEALQRCLEPFFTTKTESGTGLGLAVTLGVVRRHEGTIDVESEEGRGTTFTIRLPSKAQENIGVEEEKPGIVPQAMSILLVEDEPLVREVNATYLQSDGHIVETAANGREGLEKFRAGDFDLVITDMAMPEMNGAYLTAAIKEIVPDKPVILLTGFGEMAEGVGKGKVTADLILSKPLSLVELRRAIVKVVQPGETG